MKVIIVEVTRAANSFGQTHLGEIREAYELIAGIVTKAQEEGVFRADIEARFAAMAFYGAIEQLLTGWIFGLLPQGPERLRAGQVAGRRDRLRRPRDRDRRRGERGVRDRSRSASSSDCGRRGFDGDATGQ